MKKYLHPSNILIPKCDFSKWAVIACDQYTSDYAYWNRVEEFVGKKPSALNLVLPEIYLDESKLRIEKINRTMKKYLEDGIFNEIKSSMIYVERTFANKKIRHGIVGMIDLEDYDYNKGSKALIRATEETVVERIPPRVEIRRDALIELPHILLFINDPDDTVIGAIKKNKEKFNAAYSFKLMENAGEIKGYYIDEDSQTQINTNLEHLIKDGLLFAVGDGNHSLATAKECHKINNTELSRFALVEVVNIHDTSIEFEPIYRVLFGVDKNSVINAMNEFFSTDSIENTHTFDVYDKNGFDKISVEAISKLPVGTLQTFLDKYIEANPHIKIDYIHGVQETKKLCQQNDNTVGFIFDGMQKSELFDAVVLDGSLPRKTFSMGTADEKRFYIEGRKIK